MISLIGRSKHTGTILAGIAALGLAEPTLAAGTDPGGTRAGTSVFNQAQVTYQVNNVAQTPVLSDDDGVASNGVNPTEFVVDRKLDVLVAERSLDYNSATTPTSPPGQNGAVLAWTVTNEGNQTQDFLLTVASTAFDPFGGSDNFDATVVGVFVDANGNGTYEAGVDVGTYIDELDINQSISVFFVGNIPSTQVDGDIAAYVLEAQVAEGGGAGVPGAAISTDDRLSGDSRLGVEDVFADGANTNNGGDDDRDGIHSSEDAYQISGAVLSVVKTSLVVSDPYTCPGGVCPVSARGPKATPGAIVEYTITIANAAGASRATNVVVADDLSSEMTGPNPRLAFKSDGYGAADIRMVYTPAVGARVTTDMTEEADADNGQFIGNTVTVSNLTLNAGDQAEVSFRVEIQ